MSSQAIQHLFGESLLQWGTADFVVVERRSTGMKSWKKGVEGVHAHSALLGPVWFHTDFRNFELSPKVPSLQVQH